MPAPTTNTTHRATGVTIAEFYEWTEKIKERTWFRDWGKRPVEEMPSHEFKYMYPRMAYSVDTRDMQVFYIGCDDSSGKMVEASEGENFTGTVCELFETRLNERLAKRES